MPYHAHVATGKQGEAFVCTFLKQEGYTILSTNYKTPLGEIDIIGIKDKTLFIIEVKTRSSAAFGMPYEAVNARKLTHMRNACAWFLQKNPQYKHLPVSLQVASVQKNAGAFFVKLYTVVL